MACLLEIAGTDHWEFWHICLNVSVISPVYKSSYNILFMFHEIHESNLKIALNYNQN